MNLEKVIFIGGSGRCGSTLIAELLDFHPEVASIFEVHSFVFLLKLIKNGIQPGMPLLKSQYKTIEQALLPETEYNWRITADEALFSWEKFIIEPVSSGESLLKSARNWLDYIHTIQIIRDGSNFIAHKTPVLTMYLPEIKKLYPESLFLHIIRKPQDVIFSYLEQNWGPANLDEGINWYCERVESFYKQKENFSDVIEIKFEELISNPVLILDSIQNAANIQNNTNHILSYNLIDTDKLNHRKNQIREKDLKYILRTVRERLPKVALVYEE